MSTKVGTSTLSTTGVPWTVIASVPVPVNVVLNSPPLIIEAPSTLLMSQVSELSKARTWLPPMVTDSSSRCSRNTSSAWSARNTSPSPLTFIRAMPSLVMAFFSILAMPPLPS